jgi:hypothetical protein
VIRLMKYCNGITRILPCREFQTTNVDALSGFVQTNGRLLLNCGTLWQFSWNTKSTSDDYARLILE